MDFPNFNNENPDDQIQVENLDNNNFMNNYDQFNEVHNTYNAPTNDWGNNFTNNYDGAKINDFAMAIDEQEENRILMRRQEEEERRARIVQLMNDEMRIKQEWRSKAQDYLENFERQRHAAIEKRRQFNMSNEEEVIKNRNLVKEGKMNPWEKVVENIEIKESEYKGSKDISRMRNVILNRKNDFTQMKMK